MSTPEYKVRLADVTREPSDLLLLKYAQAPYGVDQDVATMLTSSRLCRRSDIQPKPGDYSIVDTMGTGDRVSFNLDRRS